MENNLHLVHETVIAMKGDAFDVWVAGGWAEELREIHPPKPHDDIDLFLNSKNFDDIDLWLQGKPELEEIERKRWSHKRAWIVRGVMVECILIRPDLTTSFFDERLVMTWPRDIFQGNPKYIRGLPVISLAALDLCRARYPEMAEARRDWGATQQTF